MPKTQRRIVNIKESTWKAVQEYAKEHDLVFKSFDEVLCNMLDSILNLSTPSKS